MSTDLVGDTEDHKHSTQDARGVPEVGSACPHILGPPELPLSPAGQLCLVRLLTPGHNHGDFLAV